MTLISKVGVALTKSCTYLYINMKILIISFDYQKFIAKHIPDVLYVHGYDY